MNDAMWLRAGIEEAGRLAGWLLAQERTERTIERLGLHLAECLARGGRVLTCGNGGSMCDAMHMAEELSGRFKADRRAFPALAMSDPAYLSCVSNDYGYEQVFVRGVEAWGQPGDVLVGFSTSGNSPNVVAAARSARARGMTVIGMLGRDGGQMAALCDMALVVPASGTDRIQEIHIKVVHLIIEGIERQLVPGNYPAAAVSGDPA
jgi:D-sedoheptulose 7-phosphate isomerase